MAEDDGRTRADFFEEDIKTLALDECHRHRLALQDRPRAHDCVLIAA